MRDRRTVVVVGEAMLDRDIEGRVTRVCPDAPVPVLDVEREVVRPGGAALAAALVARSAPTVLVTPLGHDDAGAEIRRLLQDAGVGLIALELSGPTPEKVRVRAAGQSICRIDRGEVSAQPPVELEELTAELPHAAGILVSDYGRGLTWDPGLRAALAGRPLGMPLVWDPHPRGAPPIDGVTLVTPNDSEVRAFSGSRDHGCDTRRALLGVVRAAEELRSRWSAGAVAVTLGRDGAVLMGADGGPLVVPSERIVDGDSCGAGDAFAAAAVVSLAQGAPSTSALQRAVSAAGMFVATGAAGGIGADPSTPTVRPTSSPRRGSAEGPPDPFRVAAEVRSAGGTLVATGGCFDLLHAGHLRLLRQARALGDALVVCLNSDRSVTRLKGPGRPLVPAAERRELLLALDCVDAVLDFDEATPVDALERLRPTIFAKGADHQLVDMPETETMRTWGGRTVLLPYLDDHSTTRLATARAALT